MPMSHRYDSWVWVTQYAWLMKVLDSKIKKIEKNVKKFFWTIFEISRFSRTSKKIFFRFSFLLIWKIRENQSELENEGRNTKQTLRTSLAGCEVNERLVNKFDSVKDRWIQISNSQPQAAQNENVHFQHKKAILSENERMEKTGLFVIHPYSNFRFVWDLLTLGMCHLVQKLVVYDRLTWPYGIEMTLSITYAIYKYFMYPSIYGVSCIRIRSS